MMSIKKTVLLYSVVLAISFTYGQNYTSYFTGSRNDLSVAPSGGICLMGGARENDEAMKWFLRRANGGDVLVIRTSGADGYNDYLYNTLGIDVNSVETIVFNRPEASYEPYVLSKIRQAEAIWIAGGNQWNYLTYWRNTPVDSLINIGIKNRKLVIGGTSAGMAIQGSLYFTAQHGTITSAAALSNPYHPNLTIDSSRFIDNEFLKNVITDTHYDNPDRRGRHVAFIARALVDYGIPARGIACDEYTAVCIEPNGLARVFGNFPSYDDNAYFLQLNCEIADNIPEFCKINIPLHWKNDERPIKVYKLKGTPNGNNTFNLKDWRTGVGGIWEHWHVNNGTLITAAGNAPDCRLVDVFDMSRSNVIKIFPNPCSSFVQVSSENTIWAYELRDLNGKLIKSSNKISGNPFSIELTGISPGVYFLCFTIEDAYIVKKITKYRHY